MRKICVVTTTRAEYGLLKPLLRQIEDDKALQLQLIVSGTHLDKNFGETYKEIEAEFSINEKIAMNLSSDTPVSLSLSMAELQKDITLALSRLSPDIIVLLGDRYEILSIATAAMMLHIPIAHIHGGEITEGAIDDNIRHAVTKLSLLHFTAAQEYADRVIQLGEDPARVFNVGSLGVENIKNLKLLDRHSLEKNINFSLGKKNLLVTYHPQTLSIMTPKEQFHELLCVLENLKDTTIVFTKANADEGGKEINKMIDTFVKKHKKRAVAFNSLGQLRYFSIIQYVDAVIGNSSSGILEVPSFCKPTINIGERQEGRLKAQSIIDCKIEQADIQRAIETAYNKDFLKNISDIKSPFEMPNSAKRIKEILKKNPINGILRKKFYDIKGCFHE
ncbi:UDP-N-acetylglucosamine 2-epimerase [Sulfurimonas paralvinellae]|uniref:UDP-N-acetylglucosamine 2-epimerase (Hydrolyzing) n=1 Tax=Sulfurimonas paralvinellae TaxID=317658 RepID=A0A7M1B574_9BACT|nr:UDP-N-acetylglucosamine 2-epimerase [Sulfurimonas paralvinellae]QOP44883.1 UDP-N-acetylglucosamine 2-epimerase (hydrolyzing) [Sulfurimonas paralvinellae]